MGGFLSNNTEGWHRGVKTNEQQNPGEGTADCCRKYEKIL